MFEGHTVHWLPAQGHNGVQWDTVTFWCGDMINKKTHKTGIKKVFKYVRPQEQHNECRYVIGHLLTRFLNASYHDRVRMSMGRYFRWMCSLRWERLVSWEEIYCRGQRLTITGEEYKDY